MSMKPPLSSTLSQPLWTVPRTTSAFFLAPRHLAATSGCSRIATSGPCTTSNSVAICCVL